MCVKVGVTFEPRDDRAHYLTRWITILKAHNQTVFTATSQPQKEAV